MNELSSLFFVSCFFIIAHVVFFAMHIWAYSKDGIGLSMMMFVA